MNPRRLVASSGSVVLLSLGLAGVASPAYAGHVACGQTIVVNTVLHANVGPCTTGLTIGADNVTLDLNGFTVSGTAGTGEGPGIGVFGQNGVTVKDGTVTQFDAGVSIEEGSGNSVLGMKVVGNRGGNTIYGDGIALFLADHNTVRGNLVQNNGRYSGIGLIGSAFNVIDGNNVTDNNQDPNNSTGIRIENGPASNDNTITNNRVINSGLDGIQVFAGGSRNQIKFNQVIGSRRDGIDVFAGSNANVIEGNNVRSNGGNGIFIRSAAGNFPAPANNQILRNFAFGNALSDLRDAQLACGTNQWHGNQAGSFTPACVLNP